jgi:hypothetical protein
MKPHVIDETGAKLLDQFVAQRGRDIRLCLHPKYLDLQALIENKAPPDKPRWNDPDMIRAAELLIDCICRAYKSQKITGKPFVPIASSHLKQLCGRDKNRAWRYKEVVTMLECVGVIEENPRYSSGFAGNEGFTKSYKLARAYHRGIQLGMTAHLVKSKARIGKDKSKPRNELENAVAANVARLRVDWDAIGASIRRPGMTMERKVRIVEDANKIEMGLVDLSAGRTQRRLYHVMNRAARETRDAVRLHGERLVDLDVKSCQPVLLLLLCPDEERERYKEILRGDVYGLSGSDRETAKSEFGRFAFGKYRNKNSFGEAFTSMFPRFAEAIRRFDGSLCRYLQDEEAAICVHGVGARLLQQGIFWIGIHDGFMVREQDAALVGAIIQEEFAKQIPDFPVEVRGMPEMLDKKALEKSYENI